MSTNSSVSITLFNAEGTGKRPLSPYGDNTFIFVTKKMSSLRDAFLFMVNQFSLSIPLDIKEPVRTYRRKKALEEYKTSKITSIAIDIDEIFTKEDYIKTIEYFKENNYAVILGKSKGWNGKTKFTIKGILKVNLTNNSEIIKNALSLMQSELGDICKIDLSVASITSLQAPSKSSFIIHYNEHGKIISDDNVYIEEVKNTLEDSKMSIKYDNNVIDECVRIFNNLGYRPYSNSINENGSINFCHPSEVKSKGGFFWYSTNPLIMHHNNKDRSVSIFHLLKDTEIGKEWLKSKTKEEQKHQLIKPLNSQRYKKFLYVNERYLNFNNKDKSDMLDEFLDSDNGVFKIKSAMGTAKSSGISLCIEKAHARGESVILVTNRVSVAKDFADKYNLMIYKNPDSINYSGSLVVQYDSLHRYNITKYDVVVFDEYASLLLHHRANLTDNANINAVKFKILMEKKKVLIADAFLTGYEDRFFKDRDIYAVLNEYKDNIELKEYKNKEFFVSSLIDCASNIKKGEHISASFTSLNVMKVVETELKNKGIKVISLSSETSELTRNIIYDRFKESSHSSFDVILFTPTLTVGVSNLNNISKHFHYDSGMSTDVISSLQMIKRSRNTEEIHYYLEERQMYYDTDIDSINNSAEKNINNFYTNKDKTLLVDVCYDTGELKLTPLAKYINEIEVFYNILANNHANAFKLLLDYQFDGNIETIEYIDETFSIREKIKEVKDKIKKETIEMLHEYSDVIWEPSDVDMIKTKITDLNDEERTILLIDKIQSKFKKQILRKDIIDLIQLEIENDFKFITKIKKYNVALKALNDNEYTKYILSQAISNDIASLQNKKHIKFLEYILSLNNIKLRKWYSKNNIREAQDHKKFEKFLKQIGYYWKDNKLQIEQNIVKFYKYI